MRARFGQQVHSLLERLSQDLSYALRQLRKSPIFSLTVIATLALGVGANTAVFTLLRGVVYPTLPVPSPQQLFVLHGIRTPNDQAWLYSQPAFERLRQTANSDTDHSAIAAHSYLAEGNLADHNSGETTRAKMQLVSTNFFSVLDTPAALGSVLSPQDAAQSGTGWPAVLRYGFWQQHFAADPGIVGRTLVLNGAQIFVAGVAPRDFYGVIPGESPDFWLPLEAQQDVRYAGPFDSLGREAGVHLDAPYNSQSAFFWLTLIARVPPGAAAISLAQWDAAFAPDRELYAKFAGKSSEALASRFSLLSAARSESPFSEHYAEPLFVLMGMVALLLLIACLNLANLQRTRVVQRSHEFAIRAALGASQPRVLQQLLVESALLALCGGALSILVARMAGSALLHWSLQNDTSLSLHFDAGVYLFSLGLLAAAVLFFQILPARQLIFGNALPQGGLTSRRTAIGSAGGRSAHLMLAAQITLSVLLLSLASMFLRTLTNLNRMDAGLDRGHLLTVRFDFHDANYDDVKRESLYPQMIDRVTGLPGVRAVALDRCPPPNCLWNTPIHAAGISDDARGLSEAQQDDVGSGYFHAMGMALLRGREFDSGDRPQAAQVAVVNHSFAVKLFGPGENPIGHRIGLEAAPGDARYLIVGEIVDARVNDLRSPAAPMLYLAQAQQSPGSGSLVIRTVSAPQAIAASVQAGLREVDRQLPITEIMPLDAAYARTLTTEALLARLTSTFSVLALVLAAIGLYGVLSFRVARRTSEFGLRMALGATRSQILLLVLTQSFRITALGIAAGGILAALWARSLHALLFGIGNAGVSAWLTSAGVLACVSVLAAYLPAYRAAHTEPMEALRLE
ncbi:putative permease [Silvibacterium bohemicum]|uniref:Putative permease n=1 Tax=Silvibacterium bohemicum TaxID=1577686 RepID=A0A841K0E2_9BACT|nr:ADOP family duplicated permease [Silvibacterium bohemicum]MBB6147062.1 putative permease [Silvibacterium bohemicum]